MLSFSHRTPCALAVLTLAACHSAAAPPAAPRATDPKAQVEFLGALVERYWAETAAISPWFSLSAGGTDLAAERAENLAPQSLADALAIEQRYLAAAEVVPRSALDAQSALTHDIFLRERSLAIEGFTYPAELLPVDPFDGIPLEFALREAGAERFALSSDADYERWRERSMGFVRWTAQAIENLRDGVRRGYTAPRILVEESLAPLAALGEDTQRNPFYAALRSDPPDGPAAVDPPDAAAERARAGAATAFLAAKVLPAYRALHDFLQHEYLPRSRGSVGWSALPLGSAWYRYLVKRTIGAGTTPAELHALGLQEVERLHQRMRSLLGDSVAGVDAAAFAERLRHDPRYGYADPTLLLDAYRDLKQRVAAAMPALLPELPHADFSIRRVEGFRATVAPELSIRAGAAADRLPALLYVNVERPLVFLPAGYLREAMPGRLYQRELQRERADLPRFRRFGGSAAFIAGWGLYAATLGEDLGVLHDPEARFGVLQGQLDCALGLVLDTALHAQGWTRQRALDYLQTEQMGGVLTGADIVDRIIAQPAAALACTVGYRKLQELRNLAMQRRGPGFDLRAFHGQILEDGAIPLDLVESKIKAWLDAADSGAGPGSVKGVAQTVEMN